MRTYLRRRLLRLLGGLFLDLKFRKVNRADLTKLRLRRLVEPELLLLQAHLRPDSIVFDIGANMGEYCYQFRKMLPGANIHAFEPIPELHHRLRDYFSDIHLHLLAFSDCDSVSRFKIPEVSHKVRRSRGTLNTGYTEPGETGHSVIEVECRSVDSFCKEADIQDVDLIKIDVEGHEFNLLKGARETIIKHRPILLVEIEQRHHDFDMCEVFNFIEKLGYQIRYYCLESGRFRSRRFFCPHEMQRSEAMKTPFYVNNFWCFPVVLD